MIILLLLIAASVLSEPLDLQNTYSIADICGMTTGDLDVVELGVWRSSGGNQKDINADGRIIAKRHPEARNSCAPYGAFTIMTIEHIVRLSTGEVHTDTERLLVPTDAAFKALLFDYDGELHARFVPLAEPKDYVSEFGFD